MPAPALVEEGRESVAPGREGVWLAARLVRGGGFVRRPVGWEIFSLDDDGGAARNEAPAWRARAPRVFARLKPGFYGVRVRYGLRETWHEFQIDAQENARLVFVLNVGGLRALSLLDGLGRPHPARVEHRIYHVSARLGRRLLAVSRRQGEILRLPAGRYELESRFRPGNARVITPVRIKPGRLHALEIAARAGMLEIRGERNGAWMVRGLEDGWSMTGRGRAVLVLAPGDYEVEMAGRRARLSVREGRKARWPTTP